MAARKRSKPLRILGIDHAVLRVRDVDGAIRFYRDVLGCALEWRRDDLGLIHMRAGSALIDLVDVNGTLGKAGGPAPGNDGRNMDHLALRLAEFDARKLRAHLAAYGVAMGPVKRRYGASGEGPSTYIQDPEGNGVELKGPAYKKGNVRRAQR